MRPSGVTPVASTVTRPKPPMPKRPRWTRCQSLAKPCRAEYWHIGATAVRLRKVVERRLNGENKADIFFGHLGREGGANLPLPASIGKCRWKQISRVMPPPGATRFRTLPLRPPHHSVFTGTGSLGLRLPDGRRPLMLKKIALALPLAVLLMTGGSFAANEVLTGKAAFGDYTKDAPGVTRHITIDDLDNPYVTKSSSNAPGGVDRP